jgi:hypothetical protein
MILCAFSFHHDLGTLYDGFLKNQVELGISLESNGFGERTVPQVLYNQGVFPRI